MARPSATRPESAAHKAQQKRTEESRILKLRETPQNKQPTDPDRRLTDMQRAFAKYWAEGNKPALAVKMAGYADSGATALAYRLVRDPAILKIYNREKALYEETCQMSRKKVMDGLLEAVEMAKIQADPTVMVQGWREIGRMCGYYEPKRTQIEVTVQGNILHDRLNKLSDAELLKLIQEPVTQTIEGEFHEVAASDEAEEDSENGES